VTPRSAIVPLDCCLLWDQITTFCFQRHPHSSLKVVLPWEFSGKNVNLYHIKPTIMMHITTKINVTCELNIMCLYSLPFFFHLFSNLFLMCFSVSFTLSLLLLDLPITLSGDFSCFLCFSFPICVFYLRFFFPNLSSSAFKYCVGCGFYLLW
jgi:hypothetical protein